MRNHDQQGTSWETNWYMVGIELKRIFKKGEKSRFWHKFLNVWVELIRAEPKITFWVVFVLFFLVVGQTAKLIT